MSGGNVKTIEGYDVLKLEAASFSSFRDIKKNHFMTTVYFYLKQLMELLAYEALVDCRNH